MNQEKLELYNRAKEAYYNGSPIMEDFEFDLQFKVTGFSVAVIRNGYIVDYKSNNNLFTEEQKELMRGANRGQRVFIQDIQASGPDGRRRALGTITLVVD